MELVGDFTPGESFIDAVGLNDFTLDVEVTANRGDLLSHVGIARELAASGEGHIELPEIPDVSDFPFEYQTGAPEVGHA